MSYKKKIVFLLVKPVFRFFSNTVNTTEVKPVVRQRIAITP